MAHMAKTKYGETGQLLDAGLDLNMEGGIGEYVFRIFINLSTVIVKQGNFEITSVI